MTNEEALDLITEIPISDLEKATRINPTDLFVLEQDGVAKSLSGDLLISYVMSLMGGHGSITGIAKIKTEGLVDTYRITMEDATVHDYTVTNGARGFALYRLKAPYPGSNASAWNDFSNFAIPPGFVPMVNDLVMDDDGHIGYVSAVDATEGYAQVTDLGASFKGPKGDSGEDSNIFIKFAAQQPSDSTPSIGDLPDKWMGVAVGKMTTAPTSWKDYKWINVQGIAGQSVEHAWYGTTLRITSASGTSEANLRGPAGKGERGIPGKIQTINGYEPTPETGDMVLGCGHKISTPYQKFMDAPVAFTNSIAIINGLGTSQIVAGNVYHVTWRTTQYTCTAQMYGGSVCLGNVGMFGGTDTGEPFVIEVMADSYCTVSKSNTNRETINIKIETPENEKIIPIPEEYIPADIYQRLAAIEARLGI